MNIVRSIYNPDIFESFNKEQDHLLSHSPNFNLGREALQALFQQLAAQKSSSIRVLLPEFICTDVLWATEGMNIVIDWYPVNVLDLGTVQIDAFDLLSYDCLLIVNYFGITAMLPKNLPSELLVIEDNAHGFLSCDSKNNLLGTRFDFGLFSLRKTLPITHGAALYCNTARSDLHSSIQKKLSYSQGQRPAVQIDISKKSLRHLSRFIPQRIFHVLLKMKRALLARKQQELVVSYKPEDSLSFPDDLLKKLNISKERKRRKELWEFCDNFFQDFRGFVKILSFEEHEVPYGFVFYLVDLSKIPMIKAAIEKKGMDLVNWPELPAEILNRYPGEHQYKNIYFIPFIW